MASVTYKNVFKKFGDLMIIKDLNIQVEDKEFLVLVGPSGCGKTTALRLLAGLEEITDGQIIIGDRVVNDVAPKDRDIAMVFQSYALYPHLSVYDNMAFGLKLRKTPKEEIKRRVGDAAEILGITDLLQRKPRQLSGGQRQRVAVGRAIVREPKVFLFDEPLSNLDAKMRVQLRTEIAKLHTRLRTTMVYVTHDQLEAMTMGDRLIVMRDGWIQQVDDPMSIYSSPDNMFVAGFIGHPSMNFFKGVLTAKKGFLYFVQDGTEQSATPPISLRLPDEKARAFASREGQPIIMGLRPEHFQDKLYMKDPDTESVFEAIVEVIEPMGSETYLYLDVARTTCVVRSRPQNRVDVNRKIEWVAEMKNALFFNPTSGDRVF